jgi:Uma2 family endonuclease
MPDTINRPLAVSEYLRREEGSTVRHEYVSGEIFALAGVTRSHNRTAMNIASAFFAVTRARVGCETFVADVLLQAAEDVFYYPDVMVSDRLTPVQRGKCLELRVLSVNYQQFTN